MIDPSDLPPELRHLIEKREREGRRAKQRRKNTDRRQVDLGPLGAAESAEDLENLEFEERRSGKDRRRNGNRRKRNRRQQDDQFGDE